MKALLAFAALVTLAPTAPAQCGSCGAGGCGSPRGWVGFGPAACGLGGCGPAGCGVGAWGFAPAPQVAYPAVGWHAAPPPALDHAAAFAPVFATPTYVAPTVECTCVSGPCICGPGCLCRTFTAPAAALRLPVPRTREARAAGKPRRYWLVRR